MRAYRDDELHPATVERLRGENSTCCKRMGDRTVLCDFHAGYNLGATEATRRDATDGSVGPE